MNRKTLIELVALGEGFTTELKRAGTSGIGRELCAFANATGGTILIGVSDAGDVIGVADHNRLKSEVQVTARSADPPIAVEVESVGKVPSIRVPEQQSKPYSFGGKFFMREGASSVRMSRDEIREFFFAEGLIHFDETPCPDYDLTPEVAPPVAPLIQLLNANVPLGNAEIREKLQLKDRAHLREHYIAPALASGLIEMTIPNKPTSRLQKYRLTDKGHTWLKKSHQ